MTSMIKPNPAEDPEQVKYPEEMGEKNIGWLPKFIGRLSIEDQERELHEEEIRDLLPEEEEYTIGKAYDGRLVRRLLSFVTPYRSRLVAAVIFMIISSLLNVAGPWIIGRAIDDALTTHSASAIRNWAILFASAALIEWFTNRARILIMAFVGTRVVSDVRSNLYRHLHALTLSFHSNYSVGRLMSRLIGDVGVLQDFITWSITGLFRSGFILIGIIVAMVSLNWRLAIVSFTVMPFMILLTNYWRIRVRDAYRDTRQRLSLINGYLNESLTGIRVTKAFTREERNLNRFTDLNRSYFNANVRATRLSAVFFPGVEFIGSTATALVVGVGGWLVVGDALSAGTLVAFVLYIGRFFDPLRELARRYNTFQATMAASERLFSLLDTEPQISDKPDSVDIPEIEGHLLLDRVTFGYGDGIDVLSDVTIEARPGERIALVGETGAGKSTIIRLVSRFYDVDEGAIRIDGYDIRDVTANSLRSQVGVVLQDPFLFSGTIEENIRYGRLDASREEIVRAAKALGAHDFIELQSKGYDTEVGEGGGNLSGGQRQIVSFVRALLANPRILILDEATSSVDTATERRIQAAIEKLLGSQTSIVIAHRLNTIVNSDKIVVLDHGKVVEQGTHDELLTRRGRYFDLYTMQWSHEADS